MVVVQGTAIEESDETEIIAAVVVDLFPATPLLRHLFLNHLLRGRMNREAGQEVEEAVMPPVLIGAIAETTEKAMEGRNPSLLRITPDRLHLLRRHFQRQGVRSRNILPNSVPIKELALRSTYVSLSVSLFRHFLIFSFHPEPVQLRTRST